MKRKVDLLLKEYGESHQNSTNKLIHWICVPFILFSIFGLLMSLPFFGQKSAIVNWAAIAFILALIYYLRLSIPLFVGFMVVGLLFIAANYKIYEMVQYQSTKHALISLTIFVAAWIGQFYGHHIEGKKPSFLKDLQFLLVGPAWLLHFVYEKWNIRY